MSTFTQNQYTQLQKNLLPLGNIWEAKAGTNLEKLFKSKAIGSLNLDEKGLDLITQSLPDTTFELISEWERVLALPDT